MRSIAYCKQQGLPLRFCVSAEAALQDEATGKAHCLVLDIHLPGISAFQSYYERLGQTGSKPPVIFITARDDTRTQERAAQLGALDYLVKPFSGRALAATVARALP